jgi:DNA polymerase
MDELLRTYYAGAFNPARLNPAAMRAEMPKRYWRNLPEARLIAELSREAPRRTAEMLARSRYDPSRRVGIPPTTPACVRRGAG